MREADRDRRAAARSGTVGRLEHGGVTGGLERVADPQLAHLVGMKCRRRPELERQLPLELDRVDGDELAGSCDGGTHDRCKADAAESEDCD